LLEHLIISHHGQYDFGSPKLPMFPEALMLHYLDDLDSKMEAMRSPTRTRGGLDGPWTSYNASLGRPLLDSRNFCKGKRCGAASAALRERRAGDHACGAGESCFCGSCGLTYSANRRHRVLSPWKHQRCARNAQGSGTRRRLG